MKAGLVRIASRSLLALAVVGLSACNDDPLTYNVKTATQLATNPSKMVVNTGGTQRLTVNTLNDGFEPTFDVPSLAEGTGCTLPVTGDVSVKELPPATAGGSGIGQPVDSVLATGAEPPSKYDVTGVGLGETCLMASFGSLVREIPVLIVPGAISVTGPAMIGNDFTPQTYTVEGLNVDSTVNATWDVTAPYVTVEMQDDTGAPLDTLVAAVTAVISPNIVEVTRGVAAGVGSLVVTSDQDGVTRTGSATINVGIGTITVTPSSSAPGSTITIDGQNLSLLGQPSVVVIDGDSLGNILSESATQIVAEAPSYATGGTFDVTVVAAGVPVAAGTWTQNSDFGPISCSPGCESPAGAVPITVPWSFTGTILTVDNFYLFNVSRDQTITMTAGWGTGQDVDLLVVDAGFTAFQCTDGATGADPETSHCSVSTGGWLLWMNLYAGANPVTYNTTGTIESFD